MLKILKCFSIRQQQVNHAFVRNYVKKEIPEMKYLNVAEKHDAAKTIAGLLSNGAARRREGYSVYNKVFDFEADVRGSKSKMVMTSVSGHLLQLAFPAAYRSWRNIDPKILFDAPVHKNCGEDYQPIKRTIEREIRSCQGLIIWTDCDREGENIGFEIIDVCRAIKPNVTVYRAVFSEITTRAVRRALQQLATPDKRQSDAVDVRTELDLRTGAAITRFQTLRLQRLFPQKIADKLISYGSCQIPTLGFVAERYKEIEAFVSEPFWKIKVTHTIDDLTVEFLWARNRLFDQQACEDYYMLCIADPQATVESVTVKPKHKWRPTPMDTVEMEKLGSRKLKLSAKETMTIAEKLYTKGIISYPRTETNQFSKEFDLRSLVEQQTGHNVWGEFAQRVMEWGPNPRNGNKSDQAHPPIHPTKLVTNLEGNEARVYELIVRHFLACVSKDAVGSETLVHINIAGEKFTGTGLCIYERNYLDVYIYDKWNAKQIHKYEQGQVFEPTDISMPEGATTAPPLLTEADLIALMEKHGIGTDATHAEHINTIKERGYIGVVDKGCLVPGVIGMGLYEGYDAMELALAKPLLRAEFESDLKRICLGEKEPTTVLREQIQKYKEAYQQITEKITAMDDKVAQRIAETPAENNASTDASTGNPQSADFENNPNRWYELFQCPKCNLTPLALKQKKNQSGFFIGCLNFPDCKNCIWLPDECKEPSVLDECCQKCGAGFKMLKFKFNSSYYRTMFGAPYGWYKTCLRCDALFRDTFSINLENVKRVGGIVGSGPAAPIATPSIIRNNTTTNNNNLGRNGGIGTGTGGPGPGAGRGKKTTKPKKPNNVDTLDKPKSTKTKTGTTTTNQRKKPTDSSTNIRSFFTFAGGGSRTTTTTTTTRDAAALAAEELRDVALNELFDSNDEFDELILAADVNIPTTTATTRQPITSSSSRTSDTNITTNATYSIATATIAAGFTDNIAAAFAADDDDDDFADFDWSAAGGGNNGNDHPPPPSPPRVRALRETVNTSLNSNAFDNPFDASFATAFRQEDDILGNISWGTKARSVPQQSNEARASKRPRLEDNNENNGPSFNDDDDDYVWGTQARRSLESVRVSTVVNVVKCSGCHQPAKSCTVQRDGPNKGRQFYACPKSRQCKFFQFADEVGSETNQTTGTSTNTGTSAPSTPNTTTGTNATTNQSEEIKCNCGNAARSLTVRKEGPNKGRPFYVCSKLNNTCDFFKWGDDGAGQQQASNSTSSGSGNWGSGSSNRGNSQASSSTKTNNKPRKCGLCRQEGHTKNKCPRKNEFEY